MWCFPRSAIAPSWRIAHPSEFSFFKQHTVWVGVPFILKTENNTVHSHIRGLNSCGQTEGIQSYTGNWEGGGWGKHRGHGWSQSILALPSVVRKEESITKGSLRGNIPAAHHCSTMRLCQQEGEIEHAQDKTKEDGIFKKSPQVPRGFPERASFYLTERIKQGILGVWDGAASGEVEGPWVNWRKDDGKSRYKGTSIPKAVDMI